MDNLWNFEDFPRIWENDTNDNPYDMEDVFAGNYLENNSLEGNPIM
jgi:hypothetical protein